MYSGCSARFSEVKSEVKLVTALEEYCKTFGTLLEDQWNMKFYLVNFLMDSKLMYYNIE